MNFLLKRLADGSLFCRFVTLSNYALYLYSAIRIQMTNLSVYSTWMLIMKKNFENWLESVNDKLLLITFLSFDIGVGNRAVAGTLFLGGPCSRKCLL